MKKNIILVVIIIVLILIIGYLVLNKKSPQMTQQRPVTNTTTATDKIANWNSYSNSTYGYSIKYPNDKGWVSEENGSSVGFGTPSSKSGGYIWGVEVWGAGIKDKNITNPEDLIALSGNQFSDRKEVRENITINGIPALLVIVTTKQVPDWVSNKVYIERNNKIYVISNGAINNSDFAVFYNSFKFTN